MQSEKNPINHRTISEHNYQAQSEDLSENTKTLYQYSRFMCAREIQIQKFE